MTGQRWVAGAVLAFCLSSLVPLAAVPTAAAVPASPEPGGLAVFAGGNGSGFGGDGGAATDAQFNSPGGVVRDADGDVFVADTQNHRVRKVAPDGTISTIAGTGTFGYAGDGGPATDALLNSPQGLAIAPNGDLLIADTGNARVRRIAALDGTITTFAGGAQPGSGPGSPATSFTLYSPSAMAVRGDDVYIADESRISVVDGDGIIDVLAGTWDENGFSPDGTLATDALLYTPAGIAIDPAGHVVFSDTANNRVRMIDSNGQLQTIVGISFGGFGGDNGKATLAQVSLPRGLAYDATGNLYIADTGNDRVRRLSPDGFITTVAGDGTLDPLDLAPGTASELPLGPPMAVATGAAGFVLVAENTHRVSIINVTPNLATRFHASPPIRVLDTRFNPSPGPIGAGETRIAHLRDGINVPSAASALVLNVTVTEGSASSYLTVFPSGVPRPTAANLVFAAGQSLPNHTTVKIGADGSVAFFNQRGTVHVVADLLGWYDDGVSAGDRFIAVPPTRILDSRTVTPGWNGGWNGAPLGSAPRDLFVPTDIAPGYAVVMNVTVTNATAASFLRLTPYDNPPAGTANLLFAPGQTTSNLVTVGIGGGHQITVRNQQGTVHVVLDVVGYYAPAPASQVPRPLGSLFHAITPDRVLDSRTGIGSLGAWTQGETRVLDLSSSQVIPQAATGLVGNLTVTGPTSGSYLSLGPHPTASLAATASLVFARGRTVSTAFATGVGATHALDLYNQRGNVHVVADVQGYFGP